MVIVFGTLDIPVFETILIASFLSLLGVIINAIALVLLIKDHSKLFHMIVMQKANMDEFNEEAKKLGVFESHAEWEQKLQEYIQVQLGKGIKWDKIKADLIKRGWEEEKINQVYKKN